MADKNKGNIKEPSILVRPLSRYGGLDNIHVALLVLVAVLIVLLLIISYNRQLIVTSVNVSQNCTYGTVNGTCIKPVHNQTQIRRIAEQELAAYGGFNSSLSIIPFITNPDTINASYGPATKSWYASVKAVNPQNSSFYLSFIISDTSGAVTSFIQTARPPVSSNYVAATGVVKLGSQSACLQGPLRMYWFIDPYAPGAVQSLSNLTSLEAKYGSRFNASVKILFSQPSEATASSHGINNTEALGSYIYCASQQRNFSSFANLLESSYYNSYISPNALASIASSVKLNATSLSSCLAGAQHQIDVQALLASYLNVTITPSVVTDCQYLSLPQTVQNAACYANSTFC